MMNQTKSSFNTPLQQILLLEESVRRTGATLPEDADQKDRFNGIRCVFQGMQCLLDIRAVAEVIEDKKVTPIPGTVEWIEGVMNYQGTLVPVYDIERYFEKEQKKTRNRAQEGPLIILRHGQEFCALRVECVNGMKKISLDEFKPVKAKKSDKGTLNEYTDASTGIDKDRWWRLNVTKILDLLSSQEPMRQLTDV